MNMTNATSEQELVGGIKQLLKSNGHLNSMQAEIRSKIVEALKQRYDKKHSKEVTVAQVKPPEPKEEVLLVNELIREYLEWNGYLYTASVFTSEAALPPEKKTRSDLCTDVGVWDDERSIGLPLLANIVIAYTDRIKRKLSKTSKKSQQ